MADPKPRDIAVTHRVGLLVPSSNTTMETEVPAVLRGHAALTGNTFTFHSARMRMKEVDPAQLAAMNRDADRAAIELADASVDVMAYACLVAVVAEGHGAHRGIETRLQHLAADNGCDVDVLSSAGALVDGLHELGARRVSIITPYMKPLTDLVISYLEAEGVEVHDAISLEVSDNLAVGRLDPAQLPALADKLDTSSIDAVVLSACVQMPSLTAVPEAEHRTGLPVLTAAIATSWRILARARPRTRLDRRWRQAEELGFDAAYVADHTGDYRNLDGYWLHGWTVLAHMAASTERIRIGTLVTNPLLHHPAQLAKQAVAVDHLSGGRLEVGIGTGIAGFDHEAVGQDYWPPRERAERFAEYVAILDGVLRSTRGSFQHAGTYLRTSGTPMSPQPLQQPRPPITVGGQSPTVLRVAVQHADCWNTHGPFGRTVDQIAEVTAQQSRRLDEVCVEQGRDPSTLRRSLLLFDALDAWSSTDHFQKVVHQFRETGIHEFVVFWPPHDRLPLLERAATLMPALRR